MKIRVLSLIVMACLMLSVQAANAGSCNHSWQTASDGSSCGDRAADVRKGGSLGGNGFR